MNQRSFHDLAPTDPVLRIVRLTKGYQSLRPLRVASLTVMPGERVSLGGIDSAAAELLVNLVIGAAVPEEGEVWTFGRRTADIGDTCDWLAWLAWLDRFGIVSERGILLETFSLQQNLAMPFTLEIDPVPPDVRERVAALARECGLSDELLPIPAAELPPEARLRAHLARAVAHAPGLLLVEHPTGRVQESARAALAGDVARVCDVRRLSALAITNDDAFGRAVAPRNLRLDGTTGELRALKKGWFSR